MRQSVPKLFLHIGSEKTGTSSIQTFLSEHRRRLRRRGVLYSYSLGARTHTKLSAYAMNDDRREDVHVSHGIHTAEDLERFRAHLRRKLRAECRKQSIERVVLSDEHCQSLLRANAEVERVRDLLAPLAQTIEVVVYLRRQDEMAASAYASHLKFGLCLPPIDEYLESIDSDNGYYDLESLVERWSAVFGRDHVTVRIFERSRLHRGDVLEDFLETCGIDVGDDWERPGRRNPALGYQATEFLRRFNEHSPRMENGRIDKRRARLIRILEDHFGHEKHLPSRRVAEALYARFHDSNERLRQTLGLASLFHADFLAYPEHAIDRAFTAEEAASIAALIWRGTGENPAAGGLWGKLVRAGLEPRLAVRRLRNRLELARRVSPG